MYMKTDVSAMCPNLQSLYIYTHIFNENTVTTDAQYCFKPWFAGSEDSVTVEGIGSQTF
jgi:hypothetical protein